MPRQTGQPPQTDIRQFRDTSEIDKAIAKVWKRIAEIEALRTEEVGWTDARVTNVQDAISNTVRDVFGQDSPQFNRHGHFRINDGPARRKGLRENPKQHYQAVQTTFVRRIPDAITRLEGLITQLHESREELAEPQAAPRIAFETRSLNPAIANAAAALYRDGHYLQAVFDASKVLIALVKTASARTDLDGADLMRTAFSPKAPILVFNADPSDSEQEGMMCLYAGAVMAIRNPGGHRVGTTEQPERALQHLELLSLLVDRLSEARKVR